MRWAVGLALLSIAGCGGGGAAVAPDDPGVDDDGRRVLVITPPEADADFFVYPAVITEIDVAYGPTEPDGRRPVELRIEGALPDGCTELHDLREERLERIIDVAFEMRRPKGGGERCTQVVRRYRFYHTLADPLPPGPYTLRLNGSVRPFEVLPERPARG